MVKIKLTSEEIEKIFKRFVESTNVKTSKPNDITWRSYYLRLLMQDITENTNNLPEDYYHSERIIKEIFNVPVKLGYFAINFHDPDGEHYLLIRDCFNSQPDLFSQEELDNDGELNKQYQIYKDWEDKLSKEKISYCLDKEE